MAFWLHGIDINSLLVNVKRTLINNFLKVTEQTYANKWNKTHKLKLYKFETSPNYPGHTMFSTLHAKNQEGLSRSGDVIGHCLGRGCIYPLTRPHMQPHGRGIVYKVAQSMCITVKAWANRQRYATATQTASDLVTSSTRPS